MQQRVAIIYDFDQTLCERNMQEYSLLPSLGVHDAKKFWQEVVEYAKRENKEITEAYLTYILKKGNENKVLTRDLLVKSGREIKFFSGLSDWFDRVNEYSSCLDIQLEHYIVSCGIKEIIEGCSLFRNFKAVYGNSYIYDEHGNAYTTGKVITPLEKKKFLIKINNAINGSIHMPYKQEVDMHNIIYIGDGFTDAHCMKALNDNNGYSIAVFNRNENVADKLVKLMYADIKAPADYSKNSLIENIVKSKLQEITCFGEYTVSC